MSWVILHEAIIIIPYSSEQAPMGVAAQAPKIEGGRLHGEGAQLSPCKGPPRMRS